MPITLSDCHVVRRALFSCLFYSHAFTWALRMTEKRWVLLQADCLSSQGSTTSESPAPTQSFLQCHVWARRKIQELTAHTMNQSDCRSKMSTCHMLTCIIDQRQLNTRCYTEHSCQHFLCWLCSHFAKATRHHNLLTLLHVNMERHEGAAQFALA